MALIQVFSQGITSVASAYATFPVEARLARGETAIVTIIFALTAALLTVVIMRARDRRLARSAQPAQQPWAAAPVHQQMAKGFEPPLPTVSVPGYCPNCGMVTKPMAKFCEKCGRRLA